MDRFLTAYRSATGSRTGCAGFTLLEVMVALAVLSIALTSIYRLQGQTILMSSSARFYTLAPRLAQEKLAETERLAFDDMISTSGDFGEDFPQYRWLTTIEEVSSELVEGDPYHLVKIEITINRDGDDAYRLRTYRFTVDQ